MTSNTHFLTTNKGGLRIITFNNPKKRNALNTNDYADLANLLNQAATDESVNVVALTGSGNFYSSGNDLSALLSNSNFETALDLSQIVIRNLVHAFIKFPKLLIGVVNGPCIGITATTVVLCDIVYAVDTVSRSH